MRWHHLPETTGPETERRVKAANEVAARLGSKTWMDKPERPKGMHQRTYEGLLAERERRIAAVRSVPFGARVVQRMHRRGVYV